MKDTRTRVLVIVLVALVAAVALAIVREGFFPDKPFRYQPYYPTAVVEWSEQFGSGTRCGEGIVSRNYTFDRGTTDFIYATKWLRKEAGCRVSE